MKTVRTFEMNGIRIEVKAIEYKTMSAITYWAYRGGHLLGYSADLNKILKKGLKCLNS